MSPLQHDELLTQSEILEKETFPPAKEADQHSKTEPDEAHHGQDLSQNGSEMAAAMLLISRRAGVLSNNRGQIGTWHPLYPRDGDSAGAALHLIGKDDTIGRWGGGPFGFAFVNDGNQCSWDNALSDSASVYVADGVQV